MKVLPYRDKIFPYDNQQLTTCQDCQRQIFFVKTPKGKYMPVTFETKKTHFNDCTKKKLGTSSTAPKTYGVNLTAIENRMMDMEKRMIALEDLVKNSAK